MKQGIIRTALNRLFFFNFGSNLLRPGAANWIVAAWFLAVSMAAVEGLTWGHILGIFLPEDLPWIAVFFGTIWGLAILAIDQNFITFDVAKTYRRDPGTNQQPPKGIKAWTSNKLLMGSLLRVMIVLVSMLVSGPFLARTLEDRKVEQAIEAQNNQAIADLKSRVANAGSEKIAVIDGKINDARDDLVKEVQGKRGSGRLGDGPAAKAIRENLAKLEAEQVQTKAEIANHVAAIDHMSPTELAQKEGLQLLPDNADVRARMRKQLQAQEDDTLFGLPASHVVSMSIFLLLFAMMLLLKIYQPLSVTIYYNEHLQEAYVHYLKGGYAKLPVDVLPEADRHDGVSPMEGHRFDAWYHETYLPKVEKLKQSAEFEAVLNRRKRELGRLVEGLNAAKARKLEAEGELTVAIETKWQIDAELQALATEIKALEEKIMENETTIKLKKLARLAAEKAGLEAEERDARERLAVIGKHLDEFLPNELAGVMAKIRTRRDQLGEDHGDVMANTVNDSAILALRAQRANILEQQNDLAVERIKVQTDLERIGGALARVENAVTRSHALDIDDGDPLDPDFADLREERRNLIRDRDRAAMRFAISSEQQAEEKVKIDRSRNWIGEEDQELDRYQRDIRAGEAALTRATLASPD